MRCRSCGQPAGPGDKYCGACGATLPWDEEGVLPAGGSLEAVETELAFIRFSLDALPPDEASAGVSEVRRRLWKQREALEDEVVGLYAARPFTDAVQTLSGFLKLRPEHGRARLALGQVYASGARYREALDEVLRAAALDPREAAPHLLLARIHDDARDGVQALYEYRQYLALEARADRTESARARVASLHDQVFPSSPSAYRPATPETPQALAYLLGALRAAESGAGAGSEALRPLIERFSSRLQTLTFAPTTTTEAVAPARAGLVDRPAAALALPKKADEPEPPTAAPKEPFDWAGLWTALFSERALIALLGFGVLLFAVSSVTLLVNQWHARTWEAIWPLTQTVLVAQLAMFLVVGYLVKERLKLHLSGLAFITVAALWVPLNLGALLFKVFTPQINAQRELVGGDYPTVPGLGVPLDLPVYGWLIVAALSAPTWAVLTLRFRGHLLAHGTVAAVGATVALFLLQLGLTWEWAVAALAVLTVPLLFGWRAARRTSYGVIVDPFFWTSQAILAGVVAALLPAYLLGTIGGYPLAVTALAGAALYAAARRFTAQLGYEYLVAAFPVAGIALLLREQPALSLASYGLLFSGMGAVYVALGRALEGRYRHGSPPLSARSFLQPAYATGYLLTATGLLWPWSGEVERLGAVYVAGAVAGVSAYWSGRPSWTLTATGLAAVGLLLTLRQVGWPPPDYWPVAAALLAWIFLAGAVVLRRLPVHALPLHLSAYALGLGGAVWALLLPAAPVLTLALIPCIVLFGVAAVLAHRRQDIALTRLLSYPVRWYGVTVPDEHAVARWGSVLFAGTMGMLLPAWTAAAAAWLGVQGAPHAYGALAWAFGYALLGHTLLRRGMQTHGAAFLSLGGAMGVLAVGVASAFVFQDRTVLTVVLYGVAALNVLYWLLTRSAVPVYVAGVVLPVAVGLSLDLAGVPPSLWCTPLMALAGVYLMLGLLVEGRLGPARSTPLDVLGHGLSFIALVWAVAGFSWLETYGGATTLARELTVSTAPLLGGLAWALTGYRKADVRLGYLAVGSLAAAGAMAAIAVELSSTYSSILVAAAGLGSVTLGALARARAHVATMQQVAMAFFEPAIVFGFGATMASAGMAGYELLAAQRATWPVVTVYLIAVGTLVAFGTLLRRPGFVHAAFALFILPFTLALYELVGGGAPVVSAAGFYRNLSLALGINPSQVAVSHLPVLPSTALAFGWAALAVGYLGLSLVLERRNARLSLPVWGYLLLAMAVAASQGAVERSLLFGLIVAVTGASAVLVHCGVVSSVVVLASKVSGASLETSRRSTTLVAVAATSWLMPLWGLEVLAALWTQDRVVQGLALALATPFYVLAANLMAKRVDGFYAVPIYLAMLALTAVAVLLTWPDRAFSVASLGIGTATLVLAAHTLRRGPWSLPAFAIAALLVPVTVLRALGLVTTADPVHALGIMAVALVYLAMGNVMDQRAPARRWVGPPWAASILPVPVTHSAALYAVAFGASAWATAVAVLAAPQPLTVAVLSAGTVFYGLAAARFRLPILLYPALVLALVAYIVALDLARLDLRYLAPLPPALAAIGAGWTLRRLPSVRSLPPRGIAARFAFGVGMFTWDRPLLIAGQGLTAYAVLFAFWDVLPRLLWEASWANPPSLPLAMATFLAAAAVYAVSLAVERKAGWLYPALLLGHWSLAFALAAYLPDVLHLSIAPPQAGLVFVVPAALMLLGAGIAARRSAGRGDTAMLTPWTLPFAAFGAADVVASLFFAARADWSGLLACATYTALFATAAQVARVRLLAYAATGTLTATVIFASRLLGLEWSQSAVVWATQGLFMWWGGQLAQVLSRRSGSRGLGSSRLALWATPLRRGSLRLSWFALGFVVALVLAGLFGEGRLGPLLARDVNDMVQDTTAVLAVLGLLYMGMALVEHKAWLGYLAVGLLLASWSLQLVNMQVTYIQAYAIPAGTYLLGIAFVERRRSARVLSVLIDASAVLLLLGSSFWQSIVDDATALNLLGVSFDPPTWAYGLLLAVESALLVLWGAGNRTRLPFIGGIVAFVLNVLYQTTGVLSGLPGSTVGVALGMALIIAIAVVEWRRAQLVALGLAWSGRIRRWSW